MSCSAITFHTISGGKLVPSAKRIATSTRSPEGSNMKFAFVAQGLPPVWLGQSAMFSSQIGEDGQVAQGRWLGQTAVYYRLLHGLNPDDYCLITQDYGDVSPQAYNAQSESPGKYYILPSWLQFKRGWRFGAVRWANIILRALELARIVRREKCAAVVACTSDIFDLPAAYLASRMTRTRFYPYFFDYYSHMSAGYESSAFAHRFEPRMVKAAARVIVTNAFMCDELRPRYGDESKVIHNPCGQPGYAFA